MGSFVWIRTIPGDVIIVDFWMIKYSFYGKDGNHYCGVSAELNSVTKVCDGDNDGILEDDQVVIISTSEKTLVEQRAKLLRPT